MIIIIIIIIIILIIIIIIIIIIITTLFKYHHIRLKIKMSLISFSTVRYFRCSLVWLVKRSTALGRRWAGVGPARANAGRPMVANGYV